MMIRQRPFRRGQRVAMLIRCPRAGIMVRKVTIIGFDHGFVRVLGDAKETTVFIVNIDSGWDESYTPGKWRERIK